MDDEPRHEIDWTTRDRRQIRLPRGAYAMAGSVWHVTLATRPGMSPQFIGDVLCSLIIRVVEERCALRECLAHLYCVMPDHVHLLLEIRNDDLVSVVSDLKSCIARKWWAFGGQGSPWQRRFHDRGIRTPREFEEVVRYILENPVNAGLSETWEEYPYVGGRVLAAKEP